MCMNIGLYSYLSDTSSVQDRTSRLSILTGVFGLGNMIGVQIGGHVSDYIFIFVSAGMLGILGIFYTVFIIEESLDKTLGSNGKESALSQMLGCLKTTLKKRPGRDRMMVFISLFQFMCFMLCVNTMEFDYLMTRLKFSWTRKHYGNFLTAKGCSRIIGNF